MDNKTNVLMKRYEIGRLLGQGTFAKVYYGRSLKTNQSVAVKVIDKEKIFKVGIYDQIKREISVMRLVKHPNVIRLYEVMATKMRIYFVLEFAKGGELFNKVARGRFKEELALKYFQQLINAVEFCHSRGVYHRDIKPENILLDENENLKISDFGLSALAESKRQDGLLHTTCGTPAYVAPEVINRKGYDGAKADIWSCGVVLFVILAGYLPFHDANLMAMYRKIEKADYKCPNWFPPEVRRMLCRILDPNPHTRMSIAKIKENSWFKRGLTSKRSKTQTDSKNVCPPDTVVSGSCETSLAAEGELKELKPANLNAFDIIALSDGFDLTGLFEDKSQKMEARFTSRQPANVIISKLEEIAKHLRLRVQKKEAGLVKFEAQKEGRRGVLSIDAEIFEVTPSFYMVDVKKSSGDTLEYQRVLKEDIKPALKDIVWVWQGDEQEQPRPEQHIQAEDEQQQQQEEHREQNL